MSHAFAEADPSSPNVGTRPRGARLTTSRAVGAAFVAALALQLVPGTLAAQVVCRPSNLGTVICPAPPPKPRPILEADTQALDRVRRRAARDEQPSGFVPARRTGRLGTTQLPGGSRPTAPCRGDRLGNLRCP